MVGLLATLATHIAVVGLWCTAAAILAGVGWLVQRVLGVTGSARATGSGTVWTGLAAVITWLHAWHLARPIDSLALIAPIAAGLAGLLAGSRHGAWRAGFRIDRRSIAFGVIALWLANRCLAPLNAHDTLMYVLPALEWSRAIPAVPGLGALHGRLAFNSSNVLLGALVEAGPWKPASAHLVAGFFLLLLARAALSERESSTASGSAKLVFDRLLLVPLFALALDDQLVPSLSADVGVAAALLCASSALLGTGSTGNEQGTTRGVVVGAASAAVVAVTLKLSGAVMGAALWLLALYRLTRPVPAPVARRLSTGLVVGTVLALGLWMAHGVVTSGYPLYPSTLLPLPVSWRVPAEQAAAESAWIGHFARSWPSTAVAHAGDFGGMRWSRFAWLGPWSSALAHGRDRGVLSAAFGLLALLLSGWLVRLGFRAPRVRRAAPAHEPKRDAFAGAAVLASAAAGIVFWFAAAPRPAFAIAPVWAFDGLLLAWLVGALRPAVSTAVTIVLPALLCLGIAADNVHLDEPGFMLRPTAWRWTLLRDADPSDWFREPTIEGFVTFTSSEGVTVRVPADGNLCGREPLPCTPHPSANLEWRIPGDTAAGFVIRGDWEPLRWPKENSHFLQGWRTATRQVGPATQPR